MPARESRESIDGTIRDIVHQSRSFDGGTFVIARIDGSQSVVGELHDPRIGETYRFFGEWTVHPKFGRQYKFTTAEVIVDMSTDGVTQYLRNYIDGLGIVKASAIVEEFGADTLSILRETPERALSVHRITPEIVENIREHFDNVSAGDPATEAKLLEMFRGAKFPRRIIKQLMRAYKSATVARVMDNPYLLLQFRGIGWKLVDSFALTVAKYGRNGISRHRGAIHEAFEELASEGHTCHAMGRVNEIAGGLLGMPVNGQAWTALAADKEVVAHVVTEDERADGGPRMVALAKYAHAEREVAERVARLLDEAVPLAEPLVIDGLAEEQEAAVKVIEANGFAILTGCPGVGKTFVVSKIIAGLIDQGVPRDSILFIAPFGKSAKRGAELLAENGVRGVTCSTVHKALSPIPSQADAGASRDDAKGDRGREAFGFGRNESNPIPASFIVISEGSTLPVTLAASLLRAIKPGTRVLIEGDENQLPSVGAGAFLRDLMASGVPCVTLKEIRRSNAAGAVVHACHAIRDGRIPVPAEVIDLPVGNWIHIEEEDPAEIANIIVSLHQTVKTFDPMWDMQVVTPQKTKHAFATGPLNHRLSYLLNPVAREAIDEAAGSDDPESASAPPFYIGDKVIRTENGLAKEMVNQAAWMAAQDAGEPWADDPFKGKWSFRGVDYALRDVPIVNGDMGTVVDILNVKGVGRQVVVAFKAPDRLVRLPYGDAHLMQAYALTVHKCIGSGFNYVVAPVHHAVYAGLATRENFYTMISRVIKFGVTVGPFAAIEAMIGRKTVHLRQTRLCQLLMAEMAEAAERAEERRLAVDAEIDGMSESSDSELVAVGGPGDELDDDEHEDY